jgi:hypothetical protein
MNDGPDVRSRAMELPTHPEQDDDQESATSIGWGTVLVVSVVFALVAVLVILHLTGIVGPAAD